MRTDAAPMQLAPLPNINDVDPPLSENDKACMREIAHVLRRYGCLERFGVTLLHEHFPVGGDEILLEDNDPETRMLTIKPVNKASLEGADTITTSWRLDTGEPEIDCKCIKYGDEHSHQSRG